VRAAAKRPEGTRRSGATTAAHNQRAAGRVAEERGVESGKGTGSGEGIS